jgi:hypothetical protein
MSKKWASKRFVPMIAVMIVFQSLTGVNAAHADCVSVNDLINQAPASGTYITCGGDDLSYRVPIQGPFVFQGATYEYIWTTTNSEFILSNYSEYPWEGNYSFIRINGTDLVVLGFAGSNGTSGGSTVRSDEFFNIEVRNNSSRVDISARFYGPYSDDLSTPIGPLNRNVLRLDVAPDRTVSFRYFIEPANGGNYNNYTLSSSCYLANQGEREFTLEECGVTRVDSLALLNLGAPVGVIPTKYLISTSPVTISQTSDSVICNGASYKEVTRGLASEDVTLTSQIFSLLVDGQVISKSTTSEKKAIFMKKDLPTSGVATCSQLVIKNDSALLVYSLTNSWMQAAAKERNAKINKIKSDYTIQAKKLMDEKLSHLNSKSGISYREATSIWTKALSQAKETRDNAIKAVNASGSKTASEAGMQIELKK